MENEAYEIVDSVEKLEEAISRTRKAQQLFSSYTQEQVDKIFLAAASAANTGSGRLVTAIMPASKKLRQRYRFVFGFCTNIASSLYKQPHAEPA